MKKGLVILHVDGVSYFMLQRALKNGYLPRLKKFIQTEHYSIQKYMCGLPSTTPYCQAGILYGDGKNIPAFRWWDKKSAVLVTFGSQTTFQKVADSYFKTHTPLLLNGACIAACFSAGARQAFSLAYKERVSLRSYHFLTLFIRWLRNPLNIIHWLLSSILFLSAALSEYVRALVNGSRVSTQYFIKDILNELFVHHLTRFAVRVAMQKEFPIIFAGFYTYDEVAHAFGSDESYSYKSLLQVDRSISYVTHKKIYKNTEYEFVILSDHGNINTVPLTRVLKAHLADKIAAILPTYIIEEIPGKIIRPQTKPEGHILLIFSGQLANIYFKSTTHRLSYKKLVQHYATLLRLLTHMPEIDFVLLKDPHFDVILKKDTVLKIKKGEFDSTTKKFLSRFGHPNIIAKQLNVFNKNRNAGDLILFTAFHQGKQISFEDQAGSHSAIGGEQMYPFILTKKNWGITTSDVIFSEQIYTKLTMIKKRLQIL